MEISKPNGSASFVNEISAGVISGLILCINSLTTGSLLVSQYGTNLVGVATGSMLVAGMFGSLYGFFSKDKTLVCGPNGTAAAIMAGSALVFFSGQNLTAGSLMLPIVLLGLLVALAFFCIARFGVTNLFKFIPYSVFVGLMAATGYLIIKGATLVIFGGSLHKASLASLQHDLLRPEIFIGFIVALFLLY